MHLLSTDSKTDLTNTALCQGVIYNWHAEQYGTESCL